MRQGAERVGGKEQKGGSLQGEEEAGKAEGGDLERRRREISLLRLPSFF